jgi:hypothetical protein
MPIVLTIPKSKQLVYVYGGVCCPMFKKYLVCTVREIYSGSIKLTSCHYDGAFIEKPIKMRYGHKLFRRIIIAV